jgi:AraC family transcriptional regulator
MRHAQPLLDAPLARVADVMCAAPRSRAGEPESSGATELVLPRRGVFVVHRGGEPVVADAATALVLRAGDEYRVSHPAEHGDRCTAIAFAAGVVEEALPGATHVVLRPSTQLRAALLAAHLRAPVTGDEAARRRARVAGDVAARLSTPLAGEEAALLLLGAIAEDAGDRVRPGAAVARRVEDVRALLAADPSRPWRLRDVAAAVHVSPYHLARQFRATTGETIARYVTRLRLALALDRIAGGEDDLARLAHDAGFAHHSHLSARFRALFSLAPSQVRTIVTAPPAARA